MGQVIAVTSGKGGTGKTTICAGIATCMAADGKRVLCIDGDIGLRNLDISLGMADLAPISFADVLFDRYALEDAMPHPDIPGLFLLTAPVTERAESIDGKAFERLLERIRQEYDYCLIDAPAGLGTGFHLSTDWADRILVVSTPDPSSMRDASRTAEVLTLSGKDNMHLIVNRITPKVFKRMSLTVDDIMDDVGLPLLGIVPEDVNIVLSAARNIPMILYSDQSAAVSFVHIARRLEGKKMPLMRLH